MKKILFILLAAVFIAGCSSNNDEGAESEPAEGEEGTSETETENGDSEEETEDKEIYQIGETAKTTSNVYGFPYEVTVNSFELATSIEGLSIEDFNYSAEEGGRFAVVNVTIKNTGEDPFVPNEKISAQLYDGDTPMFSTERDTFTEGNEELGAGEEVTGNLIYTSNYFDDFDSLYLTYEAEAIKEEIKIELPIPAL